MQISEQTQVAEDFFFYSHVERARKCNGCIETTRVFKITLRNNGNTTKFSRANNLFVQTGRRGQACIIGLWVMVHWWRKKFISMECSSRGSRAQQRLRAGSIDAAFLFDQQLSFNCEMQSQTSPSESGQDLTKLMKRLRNKSWAAGAKRRSSLQVEKRAVSSFDQRRSSHGTRCNGYQFEPSHKVRHWDMKTNVPKRWLREYEKKQVSLTSFFHTRW